MRVWFVAALVVSLGACSSSKSEAEDAVRNAMRDPDSATFRNVESREGVVCGEVNGKNGYGGYAGFRRFSYNPADKKVVIASPDFFGRFALDEKCKSAEERQETIDAANAMANSLQ